MNDQLDFECKHGKKLVFPNLKSKPTMPLDRDFDTKRCIVDFFTCFKRLRFEWHCISNEPKQNKTFWPKTLKYYIITDFSFTKSSQG